MNISDIQLLFDYNYWANQLMLTTAAHLTPEQFAQPTAFPWGSLQDTLIHVMDTEYSWREVCQNGLIAPELTESEPFDTLESIASYWKKEEQNMWSYINSLQDEDMDSIIRYEVSAGMRERVLWHCLVHVVNHGTQHRSECAQMLTEFGHSPGDIDFTMYVMMRAAGDV